MVPVAAVLVLQLVGVMQTEIDVNGGCVTVAVVLPVTVPLPHEAPTVAGPTATPVAKPVVVIVMMVVGTADQVTCEEISGWVLSL